MCPYVTSEARDRFRHITIELPEADIATRGDLNYLLTCVIERYRKQHGTAYSAINDILGALDGASKEFYRRVAAPYENGKALYNGDVYDVPEEWRDEVLAPPTTEAAEPNNSLKMPQLWTDGVWVYPHEPKDETDYTWRWTKVPGGNFALQWFGEANRVWTNEALCDSREGVDIHMNRGRASL